MFGFLKNIISGEGGILKGVSDLAGKWIKTPDAKHKFEMEVSSFLHNKEIELIDKGIEAEKEFNKRVVDLEGTAKDLNQFGWIGKIVIFLRGLQRPVWGYVVIWMDIMLYSGKWTMPDDDQMKSAFWIINFLVLGFLFGERAVKNIIPLVSAYLGKKK